MIINDGIRTQYKTKKKLEFYIVSNSVRKDFKSHNEIENNTRKQ